MKPHTGKPLAKVLVAMSGGVDSSVAAALLKQQGYEVVGCFMRLGHDTSAPVAERVEDDDHRGTTGCSTNSQAQRPDPKPHHQGCCSVNDAADARLVAARLGVPFYVLNFKKDFGRVIDYFVGEYNAGRTPNPCIRCNDWLKFGRLFDYARAIDANYVATGHYARIVRTKGSSSSRPHDSAARLLRGVDRQKDQSYVLFGSPRDRLDHMMLPVGEWRKAQVRQMAHDLDLPVYNKPDSQEICFVGGSGYGRIVQRQTPDQVRAGQVLDTAGRIVGTHDGHQHFTVGQRRGVGVALGYPIYVVAKDPNTNTVTVGAKDDLLAIGCTADQTNWLIDPPRDGWLQCQVKVRYNSHPAPARVRATGDDSLEVGFEQAISAVTPGQAVVCYDGDQVIGGGWIRQALH